MRRDPKHENGPGFMIAVVEDDPAKALRLAEMVDTDSDFATIEDLESRVPSGRMIAVLGPSNVSPAGLEAVEQLLARRPDVACILVTERLTTRVLQAALRVGLRDVIRFTDAATELPGVVERIAETLPATSAAEIVEPGRVVTVFSTKGGAGKTVVATNLAVALARRAEGPVVIVDADLQFGDVSVMLQLTPEHTIVDAVSAGNGLDKHMLHGLLTAHDSGIFVLAAPPEPAFADQVTPHDLVELVAALREMFAYVVVDTPSAFNDVVLNLIEESDELLMVGALDIPSIKNVKLGLQTLRLLNVPASKVHFVLNRANSKVRLEIAEVEKALQLKADGFIPSDIIVPRTVNRGIPAVIDAPKSEVARSFERLAEHFTARPAAARRR